jgi:hypothetical protein
MQAVANVVAETGSYLWTATTSTGDALAFTSVGLQTGSRVAISAIGGSAFSWVAAGLVVVAKTGIDYRKYKNGKITEE